MNRLIYLLVIQSFIMIMFSKKIRSLKIISFIALSIWSVVSFWFNIWFLLWCFFIRSFIIIITQRKQFKLYIHFTVPNILMFLPDLHFNMYRTVSAWNCPADCWLLKLCWFVAQWSHTQEKLLAFNNPASLKSSNYTYYIIDIVPCCFLNCLCLPLKLTTYC